MSDSQQTQPQTQPPAPKKTIPVAVVVIVVVMCFVIFFALGYYSSLPKTPQVKISDIKILDIDAERYDTSIWTDSCRAKISAIIQNTGDVDAYVTVKLTVKWSGESHSDVATVFVRAHGIADAIGYVQATTQWFNYECTLIEVRSA